MSKDIPQLHAIRALAVAGIFVHHAAMGNAPLTQALAGTVLGHFFSDLSLGVVAFNLMTSFLLALPFMGDKAAPVPRYRDYLPRRLSRLCPRYYLCVAFVALANAVVFRVTAPGDWIPDVLRHLLFLDSLWPQSFYSNTAAYWWLGLMLQFTLAFPLLLKYFRRFGPARVTLAVTLVAWPLMELLQMWSRGAPDGLGSTVSFLFSVNLPARLPEFCVGMWMASLWRECPGRVWIVDKSLAGLIFGACALCLALSLVSGAPTPWFAGLAWTMALFVVLFALPHTASLGRRPMVLWLSLASYAIYLLHQPIMSYLDLVTQAFSPWLRFFTLMVLAWLVTVREAAFLEKASAWVMSRLPGGTRRRR